MTHRQPTLRISFRPLAESDFPTMHRWLNHPPVKAWYDDPSETLEDVRASFGSSIAGLEPTKPFVIELDERPVGYIQTYRPNDWPDYWRNQRLSDRAAGIDIFIGEDEFRHRGLGASIIVSFIQTILAPDPTVTELIIDPHPDNAVAIRAYEKAGFTRLREIGPPEHCERALLMSRSVRNEHSE